MAKTRPAHWLTSHTTTGLKDLPSNAAWLLSRILDAPSGVSESIQSASNGGMDRIRQMSAAVVDAVPGGPDSVELRLKRAQAAVIRAKEAEQAALAEAQKADERAQQAKSVSDEGKQRIRDATRDAKQEVDRRVEEARRQVEHIVEQEREKARRDTADTLARLTAEVEAQTAEAREQADHAAQRAQAQISSAHEQMAAARTIVAEATAVAQEAADQAREHAKSIAEEAENQSATADRVLLDARDAQDLLAKEAADAVQAEQTQEIPNRLAEQTKAELLDLAGPLQIKGAARMTKDQLVRAIQRASRSRARK